MQKARSPLAGGSIDPDTTAVYAVQITAPNTLLCSAVLVAPNLLLTARHCVSTNGKQTVTCGEAPLGELIDPAHLVISNTLAFLDDPSLPAASLEVNRIEVPPGGSDTCGFDLAALLLEENTASAPLPLRPDPAPNAGEPYRAIGYGTMTTDLGSRAGVRLTLDEQRVHCVATDCGPEVTENEFVGSDGNCTGDSGGPAVDGQSRVFGIASRSSEHCKRPVYSSLPAHASWLTSVLENAAERGGYSLPPQSEPEPTPPEPKPPATHREPRTLGEQCDAEQACESNLVCFFETSPSEARCAAPCKHDSDCPQGQGCDSSFAVCRAEHSTPTQQSCTLTATHQPSNKSIALVALLLYFAFRQRRSP